VSRSLQVSNPDHPARTDRTVSADGHAATN